MPVLTEEKTERKNVCIVTTHDGRLTDVKTDEEQIF